MLVSACTIGGFAVLLGLAHWSANYIDVRDPSDALPSIPTRLVARRARWGGGR